MPAPIKTTYQELAKNAFRAKRIKLPTEWTTKSDPYDKAFKPGEKITGANPMALFPTETLNKYHTDTSKKISGDFEKYIEGVSDAVCFAIDKWMKAAVVTTAIITGPVAIVPPGSVVGPPLMPLILTKAPMTTPMYAMYSQAIATAFGMAWLAWSAGITGVLNYPQFTFFAGPVAPPMPDVPLPVIALPSAGEFMMSPTMLKMNMFACFGANPLARHALDLFDCLAQGFTGPFQTFKGSSLMTKILGMGPIPTFAPPVVPGGPVVGGWLIPAPGAVV